MASVRTNYLYNLINTVSGLLFPVITFPYAARVLLAEGIGQVNFLSSIVSYIVLFSSLGIPMYAVREIARDKGNPGKQAVTAAEILILHLILCVGGYLAVAVLCLTVPQIREAADLFLILSLHIVFTVIGCEWFYQGTEEFKYITVRNLIVKTLSVAGLFIFVKTKDDILIYALYSVAGNVGNNLFNFIRLRKYTGPGLVKFSDLDIFRHLRPASRIFILNLTTSVYVNIDTIMLGFLAGPAAVGYYTGATKLTRMLLGVITAMGTVMIPRMSGLHAGGNTEEFERLSAKSMHFTNLVSLPLAAGLAITAPSLIRVFCGPDYLPAVTTLQIISPVILFIGLSNVTGIQILYPCGKEKFVIYSTLAGALVNFGLNLLLIPQFRQDGAAAASVIAEFTVLAIQLAFAGKYIPVKAVSSKYLDCYAGTLIMSAVCLALMKTGMSDFANIIVIPVSGAFAYGVFLLLMKNTLVSEVIGNIKKFFKR